MPNVTCFRDVRRAHADLFARCGCAQRRTQDPEPRLPRNWHIDASPQYREVKVQEAMVLLQHSHRVVEEARTVEEEAFWEADSMAIYAMLIVEKTGPR